MCGIKIPLQHFVLKMQGGLMREGGRICGIKIPLQHFVLKMQGGLMREGGRICGTLRYLWDTTVFVRNSMSLVLSLFHKKCL